MMFGHLTINYERVLLEGSGSGDFFIIFSRNYFLLFLWHIDNFSKFFKLNFKVYYFLFE